LAGRAEEIFQIELLLKRLSVGRPQRSLLITGLRGVGKTVLLNEFETMATDAGWATAFKEIPSEHQDPFRDTVAILIRATLFKIAREKGLVAEVKRAIGALRSFRPKVSASVDPASGAVEYSVGIEPTPGVADSGSMPEDLSDLLLEVGKAARAHSTGVLLLFDEVQNLAPPDLEALITALHRVSQKNLPVAAVAAGLPTLPAMAAEAASYAERLFEFREIDRLDHEAASLALRHPTEPDLSWSHEAIELAICETDGYPYFIQEWGQKIWNVAAGPSVGVEDVERARGLALHDLDRGFFAVRLERASPAEQKYLRAMAAGSLPARSAEVTKRFGSGGSSEVRDRLIKKGLVYSPSRGEIDFTVPHFAGFLRRQSGP